MPEVIMPKMGDAMTEGKLLQWLKTDGDTVKSGDVIAEIETDKSNVEVEAEDAGVLRTQAQPGQTLPVGAVIATIGETQARANGASAAPQAQKTEKNVPPAPAAPSTPRPASFQHNSNGQERVKASPLARRIARERGIDIAQITGTGPQGRIIEADVQAFAQRGKPAPAQASPTELSGIRKVIARRMTESKTSIPHFYITAEIDMAEALILREKLNSYDETLTKISLNDMIVKATAKALAKVPAANASFRDDNIYPGNGINVGIAVALDEGLIVPVVRDADRLPLRPLAQTSKELIKKARDKKLQPGEYSGGTFTVSNLGSFDVENFIAIIDPSQGAILAVSSILKKPVALEDDSIVVRPRMNVTFSGDHRVMDGATGAKFLQELKRFLQNPLSLLEE